jgi:hypothetical protein
MQSPFRPSPLGLDLLGFRGKCSYYTKGKVFFGHNSGDDFHLRRIESRCAAKGQHPYDVYY